MTLTPLFVHLTTVNVTMLCCHVTSCCYKQWDTAWPLLSPIIVGAINDYCNAHLSQCCPNLAQSTTGLVFSRVFHPKIKRFIVSVSNIFPTKVGGEYRAKNILCLLDYRGKYTQFVDGTSLHVGQGYPTASVSRATHVTLSLIWATASTNPQYGCSAVAGRRKRQAATTTGMLGSWWFFTSLLLLASRSDVLY